MKRLFDIAVSVCGLVFSSPVLLPAILAVWLEDRHSPFYMANRVGKGGRPFRMVKLRSMVVNADKTGVDSTAANDPRITKVGRFVRKYKLDELTQLWNVLKGDMSLVGPRPQVERDVALYTEEERRMLSVRPGITDIASIVFADEGDILEGSEDPDLRYNQVIRPYKSRYALLYIDNRTLVLDMKLIWLTALAILSRKKALDGVVKILEEINADPLLVKVARRSEELQPFPPPGATEIVTQRG